MWGDRLVTVKCFQCFICDTIIKNEGTISSGCHFLSASVLSYTILKFFVSTDCVLI